MVRVAIKAALHKEPHGSRKGAVGRQQGALGAAAVALVDFESILADAADSALVGEQVERGVAQGVSLALENLEHHQTEAPHVALLRVVDSEEALRRHACDLAAAACPVRVRAVREVAEAHAAGGADEDGAGVEAAVDEMRSVQRLEREQQLMDHARQLVLRHLRPLAF